MESDRQYEPEILIVEDNPSVVELMELVAERESHWQFTSVSSGMHAVKACKLRDFDVILMDLRLPLMNGIEAAKTIREMEMRSGLKRTRIIAYSAMVDEDTRQECIEAGFDDFIFKPTNLENFIDTVSKHLPPSKEAQST